MTPEPGATVRLTGYGYARKARFRLVRLTHDRKYGDCAEVWGPLPGTPGNDRRRARVVPVSALSAVRT